MPKTLTLAEVPLKNKTISGVEKAEITFNQTDYPTTVGLETRYFANKAYDDSDNQLPPAQVSFNLEGPWDFTAGPADNEVVQTIIDKAQAPDMASFPTANLVERVDVGQTYDDAYFVNDQQGLTITGEANHYLISKVPTVYTYKSEHLLVPVDDLRQHGGVHGADDADHEVGVGLTLRAAGLDSSDDHAQLSRPAGARRTSVPLYLQRYADDAVGARRIEAEPVCLEAFLQIERPERGSIHSEGGASRTGERVCVAQPEFHSQDRDARRHC